MEKRDNSGALFKSEKRKSESHPAYKGQAMIDGTEYWISSWVNESKGGEKYMSLKFNPKEQVQPKGDTGWKSVIPPTDFDDDIEF
jgi:hypothetical protein